MIQRINSSSWMSDMFSACTLNRPSMLLQTFIRSYCCPHRKVSRLEIADSNLAPNLSRGLPIVHHDGYSCEFPKNHRFVMEKFRGVYKHLINDNVISRKQIHTPKLVSAPTCKLVHTSENIDNFFTGTISLDDQRRSGFKWTPGIVNRCRLEVGGTILGAQICLNTGLACSTGGGTHHAHPGYASGFCMLNDLAITAQYMLNTGTVNRVLIVDCDVHHGDGTSFIFQNEKRVFTLDFYCPKNFPLKKYKCDRAVELDIGTNDGEYLSILKDNLTDVVSGFSPDIILYDAGIDPHIDDELGKLCLTDQGLFDRDYFVFKLAMISRIPICSVIGGGYHWDHDLLALRHTIVHRAATKVWKEFNPEH